MSDFLADVLASTRDRVAAARHERTSADLSRQAARMKPPRSLLTSLREHGRRIIAEVKRASPSRGPIAPDVDAARLARAYEEGGAAAVSVLTEPKWFHGSLDDLRVVAAAVTIPLLRKDFLVDPWQALEARVAGADAALLIVRALPGGALAEMLAAFAEAKLEALVEVHDAAELDRALSAGASIVGVNARDLATLEVDLDAVATLGPKLPASVVGIAESGVKSIDDLDRLASTGYRAFLVGETLVTSKDPVALLRAWTATEADGSAKRDRGRNDT